MNKTKHLVITSLCIALGIVLPIAFHSVPNAGSIFLPMHIPVLLCGIVCGPLYGLICGVLAPLLSSVLTGMPPAAYLLPMVLELSVYGLVSGWLIKTLKIKNSAVTVYISLVGAMLLGRVVYGIFNALIFRAGEYSLELWLTASFVTALPGIIIQIILIPILVFALKRAGVVELS